MSADSRVPARELFSRAIQELLQERGDLLVLDADQAGRTGAHGVAESKPECFLMMGVAESNLMGVASGLAVMGLTCYVAGFCGSRIRRALEPLSSILGPQQLNVKLVGFRSGVPVEDDYFESQDFALLRSVPNMTLIAPGDAAEAHQAIVAAAQCPGPVYIHLADYPPAALGGEESRFQIGRAVKLREGPDVAMICTGRQTLQALHAATILETVGVWAQVLHVPTLQPLDTEAVMGAAQGVRLVVTAEEHGVRGGLGEAVEEALAGDPPMRFKRFGFRQSSGEFPAREDFLEQEGLSAARMAESIHMLLRGA